MSIPMEWTVPLSDLGPVTYLSKEYILDKNEKRFHMVDGSPVGTGKDKTRSRDVSSNLGDFEESLQVLNYFLKSISNKEIIIQDV